jgi:hypothetical protein
MEEILGIKKEKVVIVHGVQGIDAPGLDFRDHFFYQCLFSGADESILCICQV